MGLSRNKVAVSEGAAGSPPFYGDTDMLSRACRIANSFETERESEHELRKVSQCCSIFRDPKGHLREVRKKPVGV